MGLKKACELCLSTHMDKWKTTLPDVDFQKEKVDGGIKFFHFSDPSENSRETKKVESKNRIWYTDTAYTCPPKHEGRDEV